MLLHYNKCTELRPTSIPAPCRNWVTSSRWVQNSRSLRILGQDLSQFLMFSFPFGCNYIRMRSFLSEFGKTVTCFTADWIRRRPVNNNSATKQSLRSKKQKMSSWMCLHIVILPLLRKNEISSHVWEYINIGSFLHVLNTTNRIW
jgi:hypothetical protein